MQKQQQQQQQQQKKTTTKKNTVDMQTKYYSRDTATAKANYCGPKK